MSPMLLWMACGTSVPEDPADEDRDGFVAGPDCDDGDPFVFPGAMEVCNGRDDDCDGDVDGGAIDPKTWHQDRDGDGFAADGPVPTVEACDPGAGWARQQGDCDDDDARVFPGQLDGCDGVDTDCDGEVDEDPDEQWFVDADGDGVGNSDRPRTSCGGSARARSGGDCDDDDPDVLPDAPELCNGIDDDCDGLVDDEDDPLDPLTWHPDQDLDGVGIDGVFPVVACEPPNVHWATLVGDCDDLDDTTYPGAVQRCEGVDNDCDGLTPDETGWWDPAWPHRVPLTVLGSRVDAVDPILVVDVDFRAALDALGSADPFDPDTLVVVVQDCEAGARTLRAAFTDELAGLLEPGDPTDPIDEHGALHILYDGAILAGETVHLAAYFGGPALPSAASLAVDPRGWQGPRGQVRIDPDRGGLLDDVIAPSGQNLLSQADAPEGNGTRDSGGWTSVAIPGAITTVAAGGPAVAAVAAEGPEGYRAWWWGYADHPAVFGKIAWVLGEDTRSMEVRPFQATSPGLPGAAAEVGPGWVGRHDGALGAAFGWVRPPASVDGLACDAVSCWTSASELPGPQDLLAGTVLVDFRVIAVVPTAGAPGADPSLPGLLAPPTVSVGAAASLR